MDEEDAIGYKVIKGRRWRCSNPDIPAPLRQQLVNELMDARRAVKFALNSGSEPDEQAARARVHCAKVALGERGGKWWLIQSQVEQLARIDATLYSLLKHRAPSSTICPSEVARIIGGDEWKRQMDPVRNRAWQLSDSSVLSIMQNGIVMDKDARGHLRIARGERYEVLTTYVKKPKR